jgi:dihydrofolate reductase
MAKLLYSAITSLDGYIADAAGRFDWGKPSEELHRFVNDMQRPIGTYLYGRRLYEVMVWWETLDPDDGPRYIQDYAEIWRAADKVVYSRTLESVSSARTRIVHEFDPDAIEDMKSSMTADISVGGAELASAAFAAGLVDEISFFLMPVIVGGGTRSLPDGVNARLELVDERRFDNGAAYLSYRVLDYS